MENAEKWNINKRTVQIMYVNERIECMANLVNHGQFCLMRNDLTIKRSGLKCIGNEKRLKNSMKMAKYVMYECYNEI